MTIIAADARLEDLLAERKRLDALLDDALGQFALYEEVFNQRIKGADAETSARMMAERAEMEEKLGIVAIVEAMDVVRDLIKGLRTAA